MQDLPDSNPKTRYGLAKPPLSVIPPAALIHLSEAMRYGAEKYGALNWREHEVSASVYLDAAFRHLLAWWDGEDLAPDSGVHHLAHVIAGLSIVLDAKEAGKLRDDRPRENIVAGMIERFTRPMAPGPDASAAENFGLGPADGDCKFCGETDLPPGEMMCRACSDYAEIEMGVREYCDPCEGEGGGCAHCGGRGSVRKAKAPEAPEAEQDRRAFPHFHVADGEIFPICPRCGEVGTPEPAAPSPGSRHSMFNDRPRGRSECCGGPPAFRCADCQTPSAEGDA